MIGPWQCRPPPILGIGLQNSESKLCPSTDYRFIIRPIRSNDTSIFVICFTVYASPSLFSNKFNRSSFPDEYPTVPALLLSLSSLST